MNDTVLNSIQIIFLLGFTIHNMEEAIWLPKWSKYAKKFHKPIEANQFIFAVIVITMVGYILTTLELLVATPGSFVNYLYLGFIGMMGANALFPHLISTIFLRKYAPGLITALFLNLPFSLIIIVGYIKQGINIFYLFMSIIIVSLIVLLSIKFLLKVGKILINFCY